jgi:glycosyltransferase involved in cell wall biosynthesis
MSDYIETNSKSIKMELEKLFITKRKVYFLPNIILKSKIKKHKIFEKNKKYIGNVAHVRDPKNIDLFLSLALKMINQRQDIVFILAGKDSSEKKVNNFIKKNNLINRLIILEDINYNEIFSVYLGLDIFLFTSKYEGSPNVLIEALSESIPIVASKIFATEEIIEDGVNGYLCNLENEDEFIKKLNLLINDESHYNYIKNNAKNFFDKSNSLDIAINEINKKIIWNFKD